MPTKKQAAAALTTGTLVDELLNMSSSVNSVIAAIEEMEMSIHEAKADGDPVSNAANDVINIMGQVSPHLQDALNILLERLPSVMGASTPEPPMEEEEPLPEEDEELIEDEELLEE